jgi:peptide/nickel transport system ATP-binding protein
MLEVKNLTTEYVTSRGVVHAVNDVSFSVPPKTMLGLVGETGSGKSATIRSIIGLLRRPGRVVEGSATLDGTDLLGMPRRELRRRLGNTIGYVGQNPFAALNPVMRIDRQFQNVMNAHRPTNAKAIQELARRRLLQVGIREPDRVLSGFAHELSGGMAQRVVIAIATLLDPKIIIADEPTTALDLTVQRQIMDLLRHLMDVEDCSVLLVTHDLGVVAQYCDRVAVMFGGQILENGTVQQVFQHPAHPYTAALIASAPTGSRRATPPDPSHGNLDLINYPSGCPYRIRCASATDICERVMPQPEATAEDCYVRCHHPNATGVLASIDREAIKHGTSSG